MILKAKHNFILDPFLRMYVIRKMHNTFHSIAIKGDTVDENLPLLFIGNHISWWDGIWALHINQEFFNRRYFYMMEEEQLRKNRFLNYCGGYSITKNNRSIIESLQYTAHLLTDKRNLVLLFPQGEIRSMHDQNFIFRKGITRIFQLIKSDIQIIFMANIIDYHSNTKPTVYSYLKNYKGGTALPEMQYAYNHFYRACLSEHILIKT